MNLRDYRLPLILAILFMSLGLLRLNDLSLYTDSTRYLIWGNSIAHARGYVDATQPIPSSFVMNAPLYPILLAPVETVFPLSVTAAKVWTLLWGTTAVVLFFFWMRRSFSVAVSTAATLLLALNPLFLVTSTEILSEAPFAAFTMAIVLSLESISTKRKDQFSSRLFLVLLACLPLLREVGAAFVIAAIVVFVRKKDNSMAVLAFAGAAALFGIWTFRNGVLITGQQTGEAANVQYIFQHFVTSPSASLWAEFAMRFWLNLKGYIVSVGGSLFYPFPVNLIASPSPLFEAVAGTLQSVNVVLFVIILALVVPGVRLDLRILSIQGLFRLVSIPVYAMIILLYPVHDVRFLLPLLPFLLFYCCRSVIWLSDQFLKKKANLRLVATAALVVLLFPNVLAAYEVVHTNAGYRRSPGTFFKRDGVPVAFGQPWSFLGDWIGQNLPERAVIGSPAKELAPFVGKRKVQEVSRTITTPAFEKLLRDMNTQYLLTSTVWDSVETFDLAMMESRRFWFEPVFGAARLKLYKVHSTIAESRPRSVPVFDTVSAKGLLLKGRQALHGFHYAEAAALFSRLANLAPRQPEPVFQLLVTVCVLGDSVSAQRLTERLFTLPQSTSYTQLAQTHLSAMSQLLAARRALNPITQSFQAFPAARLYWDLGYPTIAFRITKNILKNDPTSFESALWAAHMAKQLGDTLESNRFLKELRRIDRSAPIVTDWENVRRAEEALRRTATPSGRAKLHREIARIYLKIELFEEALDEVQRALKETPGDVDLWLFMAEVFEKKQTPWAAKPAYEQVLRLEPHNSYAQEKLANLDG